MILLPLAVIALSFHENALFAQTPGIAINEFLAANRSVNRDPDFLRFSDWVELANHTGADADLGGYFLTDNADHPSKWRFPPNTVIRAGDNLLIWLDDEDAGLHANFKLDRSAEEIRLSDTDTVCIDSIRFGAQADDISYGRHPDNPDSWAFFSPPTPGDPNDASGIVEMTPEPVFSIPGGFYRGGQSVAFLNDGEVEIFFSLEGTTPDDASIPYDGPVIIEKTTPVRAVAYQEGRPPSAVVTQTYFIDIPVNLPVISLATDPENFFDDETGIYVTGTNGKGGYCAGVISNVNQDWERPVNIELFGTDGGRLLNQQAGVQIFGGCSRHRYPQKSLSLFARSGYGKGSFKVRLFEEKTIDEFESFILRSSADDQVYTMFRDAAAQQVLAKTMDADYQAYQPVVVYLNGEYWGIHNIREKVNEHFVAGNFGVDPDDVDLLERDGSDWNTAHGDNEDYLTLMDFVTSENMADQDNYEIVKTMMDADQYIEYMIGQIYLAERDWPGNNIKFWKTGTGEYTQWRWIHYDMDQTLTLGWLSENMIRKCTTDQGPGWPNPEWSTRLFRNLLENREFRNRFINLFAWHVSTTFDSARVIAVIDSLADRLRPEIPHHIEKWGGRVDLTGKAAESWIPPTFRSVESWEAHVENMRDFARRRSPYAVKHVKDHFGLSGTSIVRVSLNRPGSGLLKMLGRKIPEDFQGIFFNDVPVPFSAAPLSGYRFSHWEERSNAVQNRVILPAGDVWKYHDRGVDLGTTWTRNDYDDGSWASGRAQFGYGDGDESTVVDFGGNPGDKHITTYFRKTFDVPAGDRTVSCYISLLVDDGAVVYLNGQEIVRINLPEGEIRYSTTTPIYNPYENIFRRYAVPVELLNPGPNTLEVEIHKNSPYGSDLSFDCTMTASFIPQAGYRTHEGSVIQMILSGDISLTACFEPDTARPKNPVVISEINYSSASAKNTEDWLEICNPSGTVLDLTGWKLTDSDTNTYLFPDGILFAPGEYLVLCRDAGRFLDVHPSVRNAIGDLGFGLDSGGERIRIFDPENRLIDEVDYRAETPWPGNASGTGYTIELKDLGSDNNAGENWAAVRLYGTPGRPYIASDVLPDDGNPVPLKYALYANTPNPFNPCTVIRYSIGQSGDVRLTLLNTKGQEIRTLNQTGQAPGDHQIQWDGRDDSGMRMPSGVYFCRMQAANHVEVRKMLLLR
ncbi:CotH kinase family protein [bacterium]|nr:CotH kinase family protein [bacterium]